MRSDRRGRHLRIVAAAVALGLSLSPALRAQEEEPNVAARPDPSGLTTEELAQRRQALDAWTNEPVALESTMSLLHLDRHDGSFFLEDRRTATRWFSPWGRRGFASVRLRGSDAWLPLDRVEKLNAGEKKIRFQGAGKPGTPAILLELETLAGGNGVSLRFEVPAAERAAIEAVRLLDGGLWLPNSEPGGVALPAGMGEWHDAQAASPLARRLGADGAVGTVASAASFAACTRSQSPLLLRWTDSSFGVLLERRVVADGKFPGSAGLFFTFELAGPAGQIDLLPLGKEELGVVDAVRAYRQLLGTQLAESSLRYKTGLRPELRSFLGAALLRFEASREQPFAALGGRAERLKKVLGIDEAAFIVSAWEENTAATWPALPARQDAGGDAALAAAAAAVKAQGFLFGLESTLRAAVGPPPDGRAFLEAVKQPAQWPRLAEVCAPQLFLWRLGAAGGALADGTRAELGAYGRELFGLWGSDVARESEVPHAALIVGILDGFTRRPADPAAWPLFAASFGQFVRLGGSPLAPDDPAAFLAHLLAGEVPSYSLPPPGAPAVVLPPDDSRWCFAREAGWSEGQGLTPQEVFLKNTYELASQLARIRFREPFLYHRSIVADGSVKETYFGQDLRVLVNFGPGDYLDEDDGVLLPPYGFFVRHPFLRAFHARRIGDTTYDRPAFFVLRSLEGKMILRAESVRVYHGFGPDLIEFGGKRFQVAREAVVKFW